ncbi:MAG: hypothetical protein JXA69_19030 [Phycisphaerae bacterium]|nr:hypothetical protein [Phycisphaerae bacterium]
MNPRTRLCFALLVAIPVAALLGGTTGYALYFRTDHYRRSVEVDLTEFFALPTAVGRIEPHTFRSRVIRDLRMWLPDRRAEIFFCPLAIWTEDGPRESPGLCLDLTGGTLAIGSEEWLPEDYRHVLRSAFTKNLANVDLREVRFHGMDFVWPRPETRLTAGNVTGQILFDEHHRGVASLVAQSLNGQSVDEPIGISARVHPIEDNFLPEVKLTVPSMSLATLNLDQITGQPIRTGRFGGTIIYRQQGDAEEVEFSGEAESLELAELTSEVAFGPIEGRVSLRIDHAVVRGRQLAEFRFTGRLEELQFAPLARRAGYPEITGRAYLVVNQAWLEGDRLRAFTAHGRVEGVPLEQISRRLGRGVVDGDLNIQLNVLQIIDDTIASLDADVIVRPPTGQPGRIERTLLLGALQEMVGFALPSNMEQLLPEQIEYTQMGVKLLANEGRLRILGSHDSDGKAMLTLRFFGQDLRVPPPTQTYSIESLVEYVKTQARKLDRRTLRQWWQNPAPATQPEDM